MKTKKYAFVTVLFAVLVLVGSSVLATGTFVYWKTNACNVAGITLYGSLVTALPLGPTTDDDTGLYAGMYSTRSDDVVRQIEAADDDPAIAAIILEIDSHGGLPVAAEEIANALTRSKKPTIALIRSTGTSAAYWAATGADHIFASENSNVGSIGATYAYFEQTEKNEKDGYLYRMISSAPLKHIGDPHKQLTVEEERVLQTEVDTIHQNFIRAIAENRTMSVEDITLLATGAPLLGREALSLGLIDAIGDLFAATEHTRTLIDAEPQICWNGY